MPRMKNGKRDYSYDTAYAAKPEQKKNRAARNAARAKMMAAGKVRKNDGKDIDHVRGVKAGNGKSNLRVMGAGANRAKK